MTHEFRIKPLSSGIGIGHLKTVKQKKPAESIILPPLDISPRSSLGMPQPKQPPLIQPTMNRSQTNQALQHQAKKIYQEHSVGNALKRAPKTQGFVFVVRALVGWGLDIVMVFMTLLVCSIGAAMAWRLGSDVPYAGDPIAAISMVMNLIKEQGPKALAFGLFVACAIYWTTMRLFVGSTLGKVIRT